MFNETPKIQWANTQVEGTTTQGSDEITFINDTSSIQVGMLLDDPEFPEGTKVIQVNANSVQVSNTASAASTSNRHYYFQIAFRYPPQDDDGETIRASDKDEESLSGVRQVINYFIEYRRDLNFSFLTREEKDSLLNFFATHAALGESFRYFEDKNSSEFIIYEAEDRNIRPRKVTPVLWEARVRFRRVES